MVLTTALTIGAAIAAPAVATAAGAGVVVAEGVGAIAVAAGAGATATATGAATALVAAGAETVAALATPLIAAGPLGWITLGCSEHQIKDFTWDCWKPVIRDPSMIPSKGRLLQEIINDERIKDVYYSKNILYIQNIWNEIFRIDFGFIEKQMVAHAIQL